MTLAYTTPSSVIMVIFFFNVLIALACLTIAIDFFWYLVTYPKAILQEKGFSLPPRTKLSIICLAWLIFAAGATHIFTQLYLTMMDEVWYIVSALTTGFCALAAVVCAICLHMAFPEAITYPFLVVKLEEEKRQALVREKEAHIQKAELLMFLCHEIRNAAQVISSTNELMFASSLTEEQRYSLQGMNVACNLISRLLNDALDVMKFESGKMVLESVVCNVHNIIRTTVDALKCSSPNKSVPIELQLDTASVPQLIVTDPLRLQQILCNLISNAIKFTLKGSIFIKVFGNTTTQSNITSTTTESSAVTPLLTIEVVDTGSGINTEDMKHLFTPFSQAKCSFAREFGGTGLGLSICHHIATRMGGTITVHSKVGIGSSFLVTLPIRHPNPSEQTQVVTVGRPLCVPSILEIHTKDVLSLSHILLVDDALVCRKLLAKLLTGLPACVDIAVNGEEAIRMVDKMMDHGIHYSTILMDVNMPVMNGNEAALRLRDKGCHTPIIAITASQVPDSYPFDYVLQKPVHLQDLKSAIKHVLPSTR